MEKNTSVTAEPQPHQRMHLALHAVAGSRPRSVWQREKNQGIVRPANTGR